LHEVIFATAARPEKVVVLNLLMQDYSIGHELLLWHQSNPLVTYTDKGFQELAPEIQRAKLFSAALTCERTWTGNQKRLRWLRTTEIFRRHLQTGDEIKKFREYRNSGSLDLPTVPQPRPAGIPSAPFHYFGAPDTARLLLFINRESLHRSFGYKTPYDFPLGLAQMLYATQAETEGGLWIENYQDQRNKARAAAFQNKHPENTLAVGTEAVQAAAEKWNIEHPDCKVPLPHAPKKSGGKNG
jgi:hypothetical protein